MCIISYKNTTSKHKEVRNQLELLEQCFCTKCFAKTCSKKSYKCWRFGILDWVTNSSCKTESRKITSKFELLSRTLLWKFFFRVTNSTLQNIRFHFKALTRRLNFYFSTFEVLICCWVKLNFTLSYSKLKNK